MKKCSNTEDNNLSILYWTPWIRRVVKEVESFRNEEEDSCCEATTVVARTNSN